MRYVLAAGYLIREARRAVGLTQAELATRLRTTQSAIARLEAPRSNPRLDTFERALSATGHTLEASLVHTGFANVDETLIAGNLRRDPAERLSQFEDFYASIRQLAPTVRHAGGS
jgi:transcriptional regulator with XRE-family HTH domain